MTRLNKDFKRLYDAPYLWKSTLNRDYDEFRTKDIPDTKAFPSSVELAAMKSSDMLNLIGLVQQSNAKTFYRILIKKARIEKEEAMQTKEKKKQKLGYGKIGMEDFMLKWWRK